MPKPMQNFLKDNVQIQYAVTFALTEDDKAIKPYKTEADKLIGLIKDEEQWGFGAAITVDKKKDTAKVDRIKEITYPRVRNGHVGEDGHAWQWQLDTETAGAGSKIRLYLDSVTATITKQEKLTKKIKVGTAEFTAIKCEVKVAGKFTAGQKH